MNCLASGGKQPGRKTVASFWHGNLLLVGTRMHPVDVHFRSLVILREPNSILGGYIVADSGVLLHDGETLWLERGDGRQRAVSNLELSEMQQVTAANRIDECHGFDYFILQAA